MNNSKFVSIFDPANNLFKDFTGLFFSHSFFTYYVIKKFSIFHVFHDQEEVLGGLNDFEKLNDVWMPDQLENMDFS